MKRIAHRGLSGLHPENTLEAFEAALPLHPDAIELDVQLTREGQVVIFHDETLERMGKREGWLKDFTYDELRRLPVRIPLLEDYFRLIRGIQIETFVEMKNSFVLYPELEEKTMNVVERFGRMKDCIFFSANHHSVMHCRELRPDIRLCFPFNDWIFDCGEYCKKRNVPMAMPYHFALTKKIVDDFHANHVTVHSWTIDEPDEMRRMAALGVDGLLTNRVDIMNEVFGF